MSGGSRASLNSTDTISVSEAAAWLGVHERTIRRAVSRGEIEASKRGRSLHISQASLERYTQRDRMRPRRRSVRLARPRPPVPLTSFVGREQFIARLTRLVQRASTRLITLIGPGGVGKTRLALQILARSDASFLDGADFVSLAAIRDPSLVLPTIAHALGLPPPREQTPSEQARQALAKARLLLVLDNLEQVRAAGPELAALVAACPGVVVLATSRVRLHVAGELALTVPPLSLPALDSSPGEAVDGGSLRALAQAEAVRLFVERAGEVLPGFVLTGCNAGDIAAICQRLDGLPLALELAAARMRHVQLSDLRGRLDRALPLLTDGPHDAPVRLQTMRGAIAWSYDLLSPRERTLFCWLSVFVGGFSSAAAAAIAARLDSRAVEGSIPDGLGVVDADRLLEQLSALIDQSFLHVVPDRHATSGHAETRYAMLEIVREYGLEQLAARAEEAPAREAHAAWCLDLATQAQHELMGLANDAWFARLEVEQANFRAALTWLLKQEDSARGLSLIQSLAWFWTSRGDLREAAHWMAAFLALPGAVSEPARGWVLLDAANITHWQMDFAVAAHHAEAALAQFRADGNEIGVGYALRRLGSVAIDGGDLDTAAALLAESEPILLAHGVPWDAAFMRYLAGRLAVARNQWALANRLFAEAAAAFDAIDNREYVAASRCHQAAVQLRQGDAEGARHAYSEGLTIAQELALPHWMAWGLSGAAALSEQAGQRGQAARLLAVAARLVAEAGLGRLDDGIADDVIARLGGPATTLTTRPGAVRRAVAEALAVLQHESPGGETSASPRLDGLSPREREVLALLARGHSDKEIADTLRIARYTAINHVAAIRRKLGVPSRAAAAALAARYGALDELPGECAGRDGARRA